MTDSAPTVLALQSDSAWVLVVVVSLFVLPVVLVLRSLINRPGGLASGLLLLLPLALPLLAALLYGHPVLPEIAVLRPAVDVLERSGRGLQHLMLLRDGRDNIVIPYALAGSSGSWFLGVAIVASTAMLLRRALGALALRRLVARCRRAEEAGDLGALAVRLSSAAGLGAAPEILLLPPGLHGAFATGGGAGSILIARDLLDALDEHELEAVIAHEIAHLAARDTRVMSLGGLLRDLAAWNPVAHIAFRRLKLDRELEADRRAAALTGRPLSVASSLVKMCELLERRPRVSPAALGFRAPRGRLAHRVANLLALADGRSTIAPTSQVPFLAAAAIAAILALQVGDTVAHRQDAALALVWGSVATGDARVWSPESDPRQGKRAAASDGTAEAREIPRGKRSLDQPLPPGTGLAAFSAAPAVSEKNLDSWMEAVSRAARLRGASGRPFDLTRRGGWRIQPLFGDSTLGALGVYSVQPLRLPAGAARRSSGG